MKTYPIIAFLAALVAFVFSPLSFEVAGSILFAAGFGCVLIGDYSRRTRSLKQNLAPVIGLNRSNRELAPAFELAA